MSEPPPMESPAAGPGSPSAGNEDPPGCFPPVASLLPHRGSAVLLDRVVAHDAASTTCLVLSSGSPLYAEPDGSVPAWVALEWMAQAVAAHGGLLGLAEGREPRPGFFVGSRRVLFHAGSFAPDGRYLVKAVLVRSGAGMLAFDCSVWAGPAGDSSGEAAMVSGVLTVYLSDGFDALARDFGDDGERTPRT